MTWEIKIIKDLGRVVTGKTPSKEVSDYYENGDLLFISPKDLDWNSYFVSDSQTKVTEKAYFSQKNQVVPKNAIFYTSLSFAIGKMGIASQDSLTNQQIHSIVVNNNNNFKFVYYLLQSYRPYIFSYNSGIDTPIVPKSTFEKIKINLPSLDIQNNIAGILSAYDELIDNNKKRIALLETMAEELYKEWFVRFRFPNYENTDFEKGMPSNWEIVSFDKLCKFLKGRNPEKFTDVIDDESTIYINVESLTSDNLTFARNQENSVKCKKGDVLMLMDGSRSGLVFRANNNGMVGSTLAIIHTEEKLKHLIFEYLKATQKEIISNNTGSAIPHANKNYINKMNVLLPNEDLILKFNNIYQAYFEMIENLQQQIKCLTEQKNKLLPRLISGKLSVEHLDIQQPPTPAQPTDSE